MNTLPIAFIQGIGGPELLIILVIILLLFGAKKLPELAKGLGKSMKEFKKAAQEVQDDFQEAMDAAIRKLDQLEAAYLSLFTGKTVTRTRTRSWFPGESPPTGLEDEPGP